MIRLLMPAFCKAATASFTCSSSKFGPREEPRRIRWQDLLPVVETMAETPCLVTERKQCGQEEETMASTAICRLPLVPFLNPTGMESPEASSRCTWLSVVRAPMAPHVIRSAMYCGVMVSRNSVAAGTPISPRRSSNPRAM